MTAIKAGYKFVAFVVLADKPWKETLALSSRATLSTMGWYTWLLLNSAAFAAAFEAAIFSSSVISTLGFSEVDDLKRCQNKK